MARRQPQPIGELLARLITQRGYGRVRSTGELASAWREAVGEELAPHTRPARVSRGTLEVTVAHSALVQELAFLEQEIIHRLAKLKPEENIQRLRFRTGPVG